MKFNTKFLTRIASVSLLLTAACVLQSRAQLNTLNTSHFHNQYLSNPALAGVDSGLNLNLSYQKKWSNFPGSPTTRAVTAQYGFENKVGLGVNIYNEQSGLLKKTRIIGTYAYHLPLNDDSQKLHFGISLGLTKKSIASAIYNGEQDDITVGAYGEANTFLDGDFGIAYTSEKLTLQGSLPNLKSYFSNDVHGNAVDRSTFFMAASYKLQFNEGFDMILVEPKLAFRGVKGYHNIWDMGTNVRFANSKLDLFGMYHSSENATFGFAFNYSRNLSLTGMYTARTGALSTYADGDFEVGIKTRIF